MRDLKRPILHFVHIPSCSFCRHCHFIRSRSYSTAIASITKGIVSSLLCWHLLCFRSFSRCRPMFVCDMHQASFVLAGIVAASSRITPISPHPNPELSDWQQACNPGRCEPFWTRRENAIVHDSNRRSSEGWEWTIKLTRHLRSIN